MDKKKLIYVSSPYTGAVVEGQVYELLEYYKQQDWFEDVLLLQSYSTEDDRNKGEKILEKFSFRRKYFWMNPYYPFFYKKSVKSLREVLNDEVVVNTVFHVRGSIYAQYVREALPNRYKKTLILDEFRGLSSDELRYTSNASFIERLKKWVKKRHFENLFNKMQGDEKIVYTAVSPLLREIESKDDGFDINKITVHPNVAATYFKYNKQERSRIRKELGVTDDQILIVTSSGESGAWQKDLDILDELTSKGFVVLNLSKKQIDKPNVISRFIPHKEMAGYLSACDAAMLWRDDVPLNNVASPSKYSEFACMGLYVVHNKTVDIATKFIKDNNCGLLVDKTDEINLKKELFSEEVRVKRSHAGLNVFSIEVIAESYYKILTKG